MAEWGEGAGSSESLSDWSSAMKGRALVQRSPPPGRAEEVGQ